MVRPFGVVPPVATSGEFIPIPAFREVSFDQNWRARQLTNKEAPPTREVANAVPGLH
jgi:hypothetical protein